MRLKSLWPILGWKQSRRVLESRQKGGTTMLQFTDAGMHRASRVEFRVDFFERIQEMGIEPEDEEVVSVIMHVVRVLTDTENDPRVSDEDILKFAEQHRTELMKFYQLMANTHESLLRWNPFN
jgi:hypothetical protein